MVKAAGTGPANATLPPPVFSGAEGMTGHEEEMRFAEAVAGAIGRLRRDLETFHPNRPAIAFALAGETHAVMMQQWRQYPAEMQIALLTALQEEATGLLHQLHALSARIAPSNGYMYGLQDDAIRLEAQAEIALEEIHRIEAELQAFGTGEILQ